MPTESDGFCSLVLQFDDDLHFVDEALREFMVLGTVLRQHLDRHVAIHAGAVGSIDRRHAPYADLLGDSVASQRAPYHLISSLV